ncbi:hypothetical protein AT574_03770 [Phaeobacter inhibens]|nr:hypothetical protein AT574_03770 [Phaeobacter inhibens]
MFSYLSELRARPLAFRPGRFDCALFAAGWVKHLTGCDPAEEWRGTYRNLSDGRQRLARAGFSDLSDVVAYHAPQIEGWHASQPGDIAALVEDGETALGIIGGPQIHVLTPTGLDYVHLGRAIRVFRP